MSYLLDTDVLAGAIKGRLPVVLELDRLKPGQVAVSVISRFEADAGLRLNPQLQSRYGKLLKGFFDCVRVIEFGEAEARQATSLSVYLQSMNQSLAPLDLMLAATALAHQLTLVTQRRSAYAHVPNLDVVSWN